MSNEEFSNITKGLIQPSILQDSTLGKTFTQLLAKSSSGAFSPLPSAIIVSLLDTPLNATFSLQDQVRKDNKFLDFGRNPTTVPQKKTKKGNRFLSCHRQRAVTNEGYLTIRSPRGGTNYQKYSKETELPPFSPPMSPRKVPFSAGSFYKTFNLCHVKSLPALKTDSVQSSLPNLRST